MGLKLGKATVGPAGNGGGGAAAAASLRHGREHYVRAVPDSVRAARRGAGRGVTRW